MKRIISTLILTTLAATTWAEETAKPQLDRSVQLYQAQHLQTWNREKAGGGNGELLGSFAFTRHQSGEQDAFKEIGWLTLPVGASIGLHPHQNNEDVYIIVSGQGEFTDGKGKTTAVGARDITIARPGQSHALKNTGKEPLVFINVIGQK